MVKIEVRGQRSGVRGQGSEVTGCVQRRRRMLERKMLKRSQMGEPTELKFLKLNFTILGF